MSRSGYIDHDDNLAFGRWRGQVASALRGARGQALLRRLAVALDAMAEKKLVAIKGYGLSKDGCDCALGVLARLEGLPLDDSDPDELGRLFNVWHGLAAEIMFVNDEQYIGDPYHGPTEYEGQYLGYARGSDDGRWTYVRWWVDRHLAHEVSP